MAITIERAIEECDRAWKELSETGSDKKPDYTLEYAGECSLCEYVCDVVMKVHITSKQCEIYCPKIWPKNKHDCKTCDAGGLFSKWLSAETKEERKHYAKMIYELPYRMSYENI